MAHNKINDAARLSVSISVCLAAGFLGSLFTSPQSRGWYDALRKPACTPPDWAFAYVWSALYVLMGIALFLVWRQGLAQQRVEDACVVFVMQLILNCFWPIIFFGSRSVSGGLIVIGFLWLTVVLTAVLFYRIARVAALLLLPYVLWVSFAAVLNFYLFQLN